MYGSPTATTPGERQACISATQHHRKNTAHGRRYDKILKGKYRAELAQRHLAAFELGTQVKVDVLAAMKMLKKSWLAVTNDTIMNCFKKVGFIIAEEDTEYEQTEEQEDVETWQRLVEAGLVDPEMNLPFYVSIDEDLVVRQTITEENIMEGIRDVSDATEDLAADEEDDDDNEPEPPPSLKEAMTMVKRLQHFLECDSSIGCIHLRNMELLESQLVDKCIRKAKQTTILDFWKK